MRRQGIIGVGAAALVIVVFVALLVTRSGGDGPPPVASSTLPTIPPNLDIDLEGGLEPVLAVLGEFSGRYIGTWIEETTGRSGTIEIQLTIDDVGQRVVAIVDVGGPVFGGRPPDPERFVGAPDALTIKFEAISPTFGIVFAEFGIDGVSATMRDVPYNGVDEVSVTGDFDFATGAMEGTFEVLLTNGRTTVGIFSTQPEDAPAASLIVTTTTTTTLEPVEAELENPPA